MRLLTLIQEGFEFGAQESHNDIMLVLIPLSLDPIQAPATDDVEYANAELVGREAAARAERLDGLRLARGGWAKGSGRSRKGFGWTWDGFVRRGRENEGHDRNAVSDN